VEKFMTLAELFKIHGSLWLATHKFPHRRRFKPIAVSENAPHLVIGEDISGNEDGRLASDDQFIVYEWPVGFLLEKDDV
jgi:hypothetical protein